MTKGIINRFKVMDIHKGRKEGRERVRAIIGVTSAI